MDIKRTTTTDSVNYLLTGRFDAHTLSELKAELEPVTNSFVLDMSGVNFIDSSGLALLVSLYKKARETKVDMRICNIQSPVRAIFEITKLDLVLPLEAYA